MTHKLSTYASEHSLPDQDTHISDYITKTQKCKNTQVHRHQETCAWRHILWLINTQIDTLLHNWAGQSLPAGVKYSKRQKRIFVLFCSILLRSKMTPVIAVDSVLDSSQLSTSLFQTELSKTVDQLVHPRQTNQCKALNPRASTCFSVEFRSSQMPPILFWSHE